MLVFLLRHFLPCYVDWLKDYWVPWDIWIPQGVMLTLVFLFLLGALIAIALCFSLIAFAIWFYLGVACIALYLLFELAVLGLYLAGWWKEHGGKTALMLVA